VGIIALFIYINPHIKCNEGGILRETHAKRRKDKMGAALKSINDNSNGIDCSESSAGIEWPRWRKRT
jgi:hypothetical protein